MTGRGIQPHPHDATRQAPDPAAAGGAAAHQYQLALKLAECGRHAEAIRGFEQTLALDPNHAAAQGDLGNALRAAGRLDDAVASYTAHLRRWPNHEAGYHNLSITLRELGRLDEALACARQAIALREPYPEAYHNLAKVLAGLGQFKLALDCYQRALALNPNQPAVRLGFAMALLALGDFPAGWREYEWRWQNPLMATDQRNFAQPRWHGEPAAGRTLLIHTEQGFGDALQFCRYAPLAAERGFRVILEAPEQLVRVLRSLPKVQSVIARGLKLPPFDLYCPMLSLPLVFGTTLDSIPSATAYLHADVAQAATWHARLRAFGEPDLRAGVAWAGNPHPTLPAYAAIDRRRSVPAEKLAPLFDCPGVQFFSLQKDVTPPAELPVVNLMAEIGDFADTAALIANLDLVISVDTAVAHLAAALGKPVWLLDRFDPCWRWLRDRRDSPWYPALRIYRQQRPNDWTPVIAAAARDLRDLARSRKPPRFKPESAAAPAAEDPFAEALQHHQAGRLNDAERLYRQVLARDPRHADSLHLLGVIALQTGQADRAVDLIGQAISLSPRVAPYHYNLGNALTLRGRPAEAIPCYRRAVAIRPDFPEAYYNLSNALTETGSAEEAAACCRRAIELKPDHPKAHNNLGLLLRGLGRLDEAVLCYRRAIELKPDFPEPHNNLGIALREQGRPHEAASCCRRAIELSPDHAAAHTNLGVALRELERLDEAVLCCRRAIELNPNLAEAHNNLGVVLRQQGRPDDAASCYRTAIRLRPDFADAHHNLATALLAMGDMAAGWAEYEWRWKTPQMISTCRTFAQPQWRGEAAAGQTLLLHAEQGFGDTIQFCRYAAIAAARGLRVIMQVPQPLVRLLRTLPAVERVLAAAEDLPPFDLHCPMLSMPLALGTTIATIPAATCYLRADETLVAAWRTRLAATDNQGLLVGLAWAGNPRPHLPAAAAIDRRRSLPPDRLAPLAKLPGLHLVSLQKGGPAAPAALPLTDLMPEVEDFADTAALVANLDLVISVDTAVAHLAAALGKPVWLLDRFDSCWRWLTGRRDSPWYPALRIYRQHRPNDWASVIAEVTRDLGRQSAGAFPPAGSVAIGPAPRAVARAARHRSGLSRRPCIRPATV